MDAFVQLALMTKANLVFEAEDTFLSFPGLSSLSYSPDDLKLSLEAVATPHDLARLSEFARITNQLPRGVVAPAEETEYLWDICSEALALGEPASGTLSAAEQARLDAARAVLYAPSPDGSRQDSPTVAAYKQCRDARVAALQEYRNGQFTAEAATDAAAKTRWATVDEPRLRQAVSAADEAWRTKGAKAQVEEAMQLEQACAARQPSMAWDAWKSDFLGDIDLETDTNRIRFALTTYTPGEVFNEAWPRFTLSATEMASLAANAPPELLDIFGAAAPSNDIESVSFEYRSVALNRSWLPKRLFQTRFWRLGSAGGELSDGASPPHGRCVSYITALVFARNVEVRRRQPAGSRPPPPVATRALFALDPAQLRAESTQLQLARMPATRAPAAVQGFPPTTRLLQAARSISLQASIAPTARATLNPTLTQPLLAAALVRADTSDVRIGDISRIPRPTPAPPSAAPPPPVSAPPPVPAPPVATTPSDEVVILAFICRRVARCPDPDPSLTWS